MDKITVKDILKRKGKRKLAVLTCYDYSFAQILDETDADMILVGDSLANVLLGESRTRTVSIREMLNHTRAVVRGARHSFIIADMPYKSYQKNPSRAVYYAKKFIDQGADAVKLEWFKKCPSVVKRIIKRKIPVMGHIGLTPQNIHLLGGYTVQGRDENSASHLLAQAKILEDLGVFSVVLECIPYQVSRRITAALKVPTIGIGAGKYCDGQVLVLYDFLGLYKKKSLKFVRVYRNLSQEIKKAVLQYSQDVRQGKFPSKKESFFL